MDKSFDTKLNGMTDGNQVIRQIRRDREDSVWISVKDKGLLGDDSANDATALNILITAIGSTPTDLYFPRGIYRLGTNVTIPNNINIIMACGAILQPQSGKTLTINGKIEAGLHQWIDCSLSATPLDGSIKIKEIYPEWFGAVCDGVTDDSDYIQHMFNTIKNINTNQKLEIIFNGKIKLSTQGSDSDSRNYAIRIDDVDNLILNFKNAEINVNFEDTMPNVFAFYNCSNIKIVDSNFVGIDVSNVDAMPLYIGAGIYCKNCENVKVYDGSFHNVNYAVCAFNSDNIRVYDNLFTHSFSSLDTTLKPASAILFYATKNSKAKDNIIYGGLRDGDLSVYGSGSDNCDVIGNKLYGYAYDDITKTLTDLHQGITVDSGCINTKVLQNEVYGYYFGIDVKANTYNTDVKHNKLINCKCGIAERRGELDPEFGTYTLNTSIDSNTIILGNSSDTETYKFYSTYDVIGIAIENRYGCRVKNNTITVAKELDASSKCVCGIYASQNTTAGSGYYTSMLINGNDIVFTNGHDSTVRLVGDGSVAIRVKNASICAIKNNEFKLKTSAYTNSNIYTCLAFEGTNGLVDVVTNTLFYCDSSIPVVTLISGATIDKYQSYGNSLLQNMTNKTFEIDGSRLGTNSNGNIQTYSFKKDINFSTFTDIAYIHTAYTNNNGIVEITTISDLSGTRYAVSKYYVVMVDATTIVATLLEEHNSNMLFNFANISSGKFAIQAKTDANVTGQRFIINYYPGTINTYMSAN
jgi:hypothetical protein